MNGIKWIFLSSILSWSIFVYAQVGSDIKHSSIATEADTEIIDSKAIDRKATDNRAAATKDNDIKDAKIKRFEPTEEVSGDTSISFPVDI